MGLPSPLWGGENCPSKSIDGQFGINVEKWQTSCLTKPLTGILRRSGTDPEGLVGV